MKALLIDDSSLIRRMETTNLSELGFSEIIQATDGVDGLTKLAENMPVDIILMDINMPNMDGMTALRTIRADDSYRDVKVFMVTSESEKTKIFEALRAGANDYIVKPFSKEEFKMRMGI